MKVNQIYSLLNAVASETFGESGLTAHDLTGLISMGDYVLNSASANSRDKFFNVLVDRIGRTIVRRLDLDVTYPSIMMDSFEFGAILQKITVAPIEATESEPWKIGNTNYTPNQFAISKATVKQGLFGGINTWSVKVTIPDNILKSAFKSLDEMGAFIDAIISAMVDSMTININNTNKLCVNNFIAEKIHADKNVIHTLTEYNALTGETATALSARSNPNFYKYLGKRMSDLIRYMRQPNALFNETGDVRATSRDNMHILLLGEVASAYSTYLSADTFHNDLVSLPLYDEVAFWQSMNTTADEMPDFVSASTINITTSSGNAVNKANIIGAFIDRQALGTTAYNVRTTTDRNNDGEYTNYSNKCDIGHFNDLSENGVVFVLD